MDETEFSSIGRDKEQVIPSSADDKFQDADEDGKDDHDDVAWLPDPPLRYRAIKRLIDIIGSSLIFLLCAPLFLVITIAIMLTSRGPVMFRSTRLGYRGKPFAFLKFRSMYVQGNTPSIHKEYVTKLISGAYGAVGEGGVYKVTNDPRITPFGRFLRRTSLDELPQLWNVLRGDMSLVGPRPPLPYELSMYQPWHRQRLSSKPGITGLWQVAGRSSTTFDNMVKLDIEYIEHPSILEDLRILFATPSAVIRSDKAY
jgi:lipopolysaccharide/colanic/teichoic acid biosynthesis glycosyltransferase